MSVAKHVDISAYPQASSDWKHGGVRPYKCDESDKAFATSFNLLRHRNFHSRANVHANVIDAGKSLDSHKSLKNHVKIHTVKFLLHTACDQCGKIFTVAGNLRRHMRRHTGERRFAYC